MTASFRTIFPAILALLCTFFTAQGAFQTAVITLVFPPGARATGLGEAFTALADDANATYFNPAGLGQAPQANAWKAHLVNNGAPFIAIASKKKSEFSLQEKIWAGTPRGLLRYNGKAWESRDIYIIEQDDQLPGVVKKYLETEDETVLRKATQHLREINGIEMKRYKALLVLLHKERGDTVKLESDTAAATVASKILDLDKLDRDSSDIAEAIGTAIDSTKLPAAAQSIVKILQTQDTEFKSLVELKIPFSIAVNDSITALQVDASDKLWVGTPHGLWKFDGQMWKHYSVIDGLPSESVTSLAIGPYDEVAVGTDLGLAVLADGAWKNFDLSKVKPDLQAVSAVAFGKDSMLYIGTPHGLVQKKGETWTYFDSSSGMLSSEVTALYVDSDNKVWIGCLNGITIHTETSWKSWRFGESRVLSFAQYNDQKMWIGTTKGAIAYTPGTVKIDNTGKRIEGAPEWKVFHSKNTLQGNQVYGIAVSGKDVWVATEKAINEYDYADRQVFLFWELLLPTLHLQDLWHSYFSLVWPTEDWGTIGVAANFINFGTNEYADEEGRIIKTFRSWEGVFGLCYGLELKEDLSFGLNVKYVHSALAPGIGPGDQGVARTFAIDAGLLQRNLFTRGLSLGLTLQNMGPPVFYISEDEKDPIPFTVKLGFAYKAIETPTVDLSLLLDLNREIAKNYDNGKPDPFYKAIWTDLLNDTSTNWKEELQEVNINTGLEFWYINFLALRLGFLFDYIGQRYELTAGIGLKYGNMNFDFSYIHSPEGFMSGILKRVIDNPSDDHRHGSWGVRDRQPRVSLIFSF